MQFKQLNIIFIWVIGLLVYGSANSMEPFGNRPFGQQQNPDDEYAIVEQGEDVRLLVEDEDEQYPSALYDGSRAYYDAVAQKKASVKRYIKAGKNCLKLTAFWSGLVAVGFGAAWFAMDSIIFAGMAINEAIHNPEFPATAKDYFNLLSLLMPWEMGASTAIATPLIAAGGFTKTIFPLLYSAPRNCCLYEGLDQFYLDDLIIPYERTEISPELIASADNKQRLFESKDNIRRLLETYHIEYWKLRRIIFPSDRAHAKLIQKIEKRMKDVSPLRNQYRKVAYLLKKDLKSRLGRDVVQYLSQYFPSKNILLHVLAHREEYLWSLEYSYLTEQEWMMLGNRSLVCCQPHKRATDLADSGWCAFSASEKYPIRCHMKYFDEQADELQSRYVFQTQYRKPTIFIPYHPDIARYYKFEEDPHYAPEFENPSDEKIRRLLARRQEIIAQQRIENNNNN